VVKDVSVEIAAGQVTALLGPNGAGKSTLVLAVGGVLRPRSGTVLLDGEDITGRRPERIRQASVAIVPRIAISATALTPAVRRPSIDDVLRDSVMGPFR
jgi:branched-chain amino acid transport system ATP-binding protein